MTTDLLMKVLFAMQAHCKNKVVGLTFYATPKEGVRNKQNREEFNSNLPSTYYCALVSSSKIHLEHYNTSCISDVPINTETNFKIANLHKLGSDDFTVHMYDEYVTFEKTFDLDTGFSIAKHTSECLKTDATLFVNLFRLLGEYISLTIQHGNTILAGFYINGKLILLKDGTEVTVTISDLYALHKLYPGYNIIDFVTYPYNLSMRTLLERMERYAKTSGKVLRKE